MDTLPAGFVDLRFAIMHVSEIRPHTNDIHRFLKYLAPALELYATELGHATGQGRPERLAGYEVSDYEKSVRRTWLDLDNINNFLAQASKLERKA